MPETRLIPPKDGATVRFYRIGHGDCFLIAFWGETPDKPCYVLIDCGYKPGSPGMMSTPTSAADIWKDIKQATGGTIDVAVITHEHQDHVNAITQTNVKGIKIRQTWMAWTEDPADGIANALREQFKDKLYGVVAARHTLAFMGDEARARRIDEFVAFELGGENPAAAPPTAAALMAADGVGLNKKSMALFKQLASEGVKCLRPQEKILSVPGAKDVRAYVMGPPRNIEKIKDLDPEGGEEFHMAASSAGYFAAAATGAGGPLGESPFAPRYRVAWKKAGTDRDIGAFVTGRYGATGTRGPKASAGKPAGLDTKETSDNPQWRRIDTDWLNSAEQMALDMNSYTNNSSLVLAFELGKGGKVLLFAADAQRGNWVSWDDKPWKDGDKSVTAKDLLARTVLYKVGHHGSHNATLNGSPADPSPNLSWMASASDEHRREFCAMITAVRAWAETQVGWDHPQKAIKEALLKKAGGRVFQTDTDWKQMKMTAGGTAADWKKFAARVTPGPLFFDLKIER